MLREGFRQAIRQRFNHNGAVVVIGGLVLLGEFVGADAGGHRKAANIILNTTAFRRNVISQAHLWFVIGLFCLLTQVVKDIDFLALFIEYGNIIAATTLPIYSILAAHANDQLQPGQVVPASGTMAFLLQLGQFFGILIGPNMISLADGRGCNTC